MPLLGSAAFFIDENVVKNERYYYCVCAVDLNGNIGEASEIFEILV